MVDRLIDIASVVKDAIHKASEDPKTSLVPKDANAIAKEITPKIEKHVNKEATAVLTNYTNNEPWYQSRVIIGLIVSLVFKLAGILWPSLGLSGVDEEEVTQKILLVVSALGDLYAFYGRTLASRSKPIGS